MKKTIEPLDWPATYAERTEIQENSFKRMKSHGALEINYGGKKIWGEDRHQKRAKDKLDDSRTHIDGKVKKKRLKLLLSWRKSKSPGKTDIRQDWSSVRTG